MSQKACTKCGSAKELIEFPKRKTAADGTRNECTSCTRGAKLAWDAENREKIAVYSKRYAQKDPERYRAVCRATYERQKQRNPRMMAEGAKKTRAKYLDRYREAVRAWRLAHPEYFTDYAIKNRQLIRDRRREWDRKNAGYVVDKARAYQLAKSKAMPSWISPEQRAQIQQFYDLAAARSVETGNKYHVDHIVPLRGEAVSGLHVPWNLQVIPARENRIKANKMLEV